MTVKKRFQAIAEYRAQQSADPAPAPLPAAPSVEDPAIPQMPVRPPFPIHRVKNPAVEYPYEACVARPVSRKEVQKEAKAQAALNKEWRKLRALNTWDETAVREWSDVAAQAKKTGTKVHVGRIFDICVEKGSELAPTDPNRKFKGRVVFQGNKVKDECRLGYLC